MDAFCLQSIQLHAAINGVQDAPYRDASTPWILNLPLLLLLLTFLPCTRSLCHGCACSSVHMAKFTAASFTRYAALILASPRVPHGSYVSAASRKTGVANDQGPQPELRIRLAAPERRSNTCAISPRVFRHPLAGRVMGIPGSKQKARSLQRNDITDFLTWHYVSVPIEPQSRRGFRQHICLEVCCACVAVLCVW